MSTFDVFLVEIKMFSLIFDLEIFDLLKKILAFTNRVKIFDDSSNLRKGGLPCVNCIYNYRRSEF